MESETSSQSSTTEASNALTGSKESSSQRQSKGKKGRSEGTKTPITTSLAYTASIHPGGNSTIPTDLAEAVLKLEDVMGMQVWLLIQGEEGSYEDLNDNVSRAFFSQRSILPRDEKIALLVDSLGGDAATAYRLANFLRRYNGGFVAVVPGGAKGAATLLTLGADTIVLGDCAELGPLDVLADGHAEGAHALDAVKALENLHASALDALDRTAILLALRTEKNVEGILPLALEFAANLTLPLLERVDLAHYTEMSQMMKTSEEYATRLLERRYEAPESKRNAKLQGTQGEFQEHEQDTGLIAGDARLLAKHLAGAYPDRSFVIDVEEARNMGLQISTPSYAELALLDELHELLTAHQARGGMSVLGRVREMRNE
jgi:hypothetical protein